MNRDSIFNPTKPRPLRSLPDRSRGDVGSRLELNYALTRSASIPSDFQIGRSLNTTDIPDGLVVEMDGAYVFLLPVASPAGSLEMWIAAPSSGISARQDEGAWESITNLQKLTANSDNLLSAQIQTPRANIYQLESSFSSQNTGDGSVTITLSREEHA